VVQFFRDRPGVAPVTFDARALSLISPDPALALSTAPTDGPDLHLASWENSTNPTLNGRALSVRRFETCRAAAVHAARGRVLLGCEWTLYLFDRSGKQLWRQGIPASVRVVHLSRDGRIGVVARDDGTIRWLETATGKELLALLPYGSEGDWVAWTPDGFYFGTPGGERLLAVHMLTEAGETSSVSIQDFADLLRRPDLVRAALN
jgi:hypothetical protein